MVSDAVSRVALDIGRRWSVTVEEVSPVFGGQVAQAFRFDLAERPPMFVKMHPKGAEMFSAEADGLRYLADAGAIRIPEVLGVVSDHDPPYLVLEFIESEPRDQLGASFGRSLAALHRAHPESFGLDRDNFIGTLVQPGGSPAQRTSWPTYFRECRLIPMLEHARSRGLVPIEMDRAFEPVLSQLEDRCGPTEMPARLHGDLWRGNAMLDTRGRAVLFDPAVYGGHREMDLAMMQLFGGFDRACFEAYAATYPLATGWRRRLELYSLYPLLVHLLLFGATYASSIMRTLRKVR